jgi:aminopeptidase
LEEAALGEQEFFEGLAELAVRVGANLQGGQELVVSGDVEHAPLVRAIMEAGWQAGASDVQCLYREPYDRLFLGRYAADDRLDRSPFASRASFDHLADGQRAFVLVLGDATPDLCAEVDPERLARIVPADAMRRRAEIWGRRGVAWTVIPFPTEAWSAQVFGEPDLGRLREVMARAMRLDETDPVAAWRDHLGQLSTRAEMLNRRSYDALRFRGPGTDLLIGLLPNARWGSVQGKTAWGQTYLANIPTEEVCTTPDFRRTHGLVTITRPFAASGAFVDGISMRFEQGHLVQASASEGEAWLRQMLATDDGASLVGEIALVPRHNRLAELGLTFFHGLFDENVTSHMALGWGLTEPGTEGMTPAQRRAAGMSTSTVHRDFMIGGPEIDVAGVTKDGQEEPLLVGGDWVGEGADEGVIARFELPPPQSDG